MRTLVSNLIMQTAILLIQPIKYNSLMRKLIYTLLRSGFALNLGTLRNSVCSLEVNTKGQSLLFLVNKKSLSSENYIFFCIFR